MGWDGMGVEQDGTGCGALRCYVVGWDMVVVVSSMPGREEREIIRGGERRDGMGWNGMGSEFLGVLWCV